MNINRVVAAVAIGVITFAVLVLLGAGFKEIDLGVLGDACKYLAAPVGIAAGIYYWATGNRVV